METTCDDMSPALSPETSENQVALSTADTLTERTTKGGAPRGNNNATTHGLRSQTLPKGCRYIERAARQLRTALEHGLVDAGVTVDIVAACAVDVAIKWATHGWLAAKWLREAPPTWSPARD